MEVTSILFLLSSTIVVFGFYLIKPHFRVLFLTIASCGFIATYSYKLLAYIMAYTLMNYLIGKGLQSVKRKKVLFISGIVLNITQLILLKYVSFTIDPIFQLLDIHLDISLISEFIIPVGVSYFTLQGIGYLININLGWEKPEQRFLNFLLYMVFFPRFLSGPIDRSNKFLPQLQFAQSFKRENFTAGARLVLFGLFKKLVLANQLALFTEGAYASIDASDHYSLWITLFIQPLILYFDFSGYTDIAIGISKAMGINIPMNFQRPFLAENMSNFWKRFHASLSSWFHDYIFMRTFFRVRKWKKKATTFALFVTWILFGIWHGAGWNFMFLGFLQALAILYEFNTKRWRAKVFNSLPSFYAKWIGRIFTYIFYSISLVFFFAPDLRSALLFFTQLPGSSSLNSPDIAEPSFFILIMAIIGLIGMEILKEDYDHISARIERFWFSNSRSSIIFRWTIYYLCISLLIIFSMNNSDLEFVYVRF